MSSVDINSFVFSGRMTAPTRLQGGHGKPIYCFFTVAVNNVKKDNTAFVRCVAFNDIAKIVYNHGEKGSRVMICGSVRGSSYTDGTGKKISTTTVFAFQVFLLDWQDKTGNKAKRHNLPPAEPVFEEYDYNPVDDPDIPNL